MQETMTLAVVAFLTNGVVFDIRRGWRDSGETTRTKYQRSLPGRLIRGTWLHYLRGTNWFNYDETFCHARKLL